MNPIETALRRIAEDLRGTGRSWALIGGLAVSARAEPRTTRDVGYKVIAVLEQEATGKSRSGRKNRGAVTVNVKRLRHSLLFPHAGEAHEGTVGSITNVGILVVAQDVKELVVNPFMKEDGFELPEYKGGYNAACLTPSSSSPSRSNVDLRTSAIVSTRSCRAMRAAPRT